MEVKLEPALFVMIIGLLGGCIASAVGLGWFMAGKLSDMKIEFAKDMQATRHALYGRIDQQASILSEKMDDHENKTTERLGSHDERIRAVEIAAGTRRR